MTEEHTMTAGSTRVAARAERRKFTVDYKIAIVRAAEACRAPGGECQDSCRMQFYPLATSAVADRASYKYTVVGRDHLRVVPRQRSGWCARAA